MKKGEDSKIHERQYWLWVTRPEYYLDESGRERKILDPKYVDENNGWWTCHKDTKRGDLIFLWRTAPKIDIGYLLQATTDAFPLTNDEYATQSKWDYACDYLPIYKFRNPVTKKDIDKDEYLTEWKAYRGRFQRKVFRIPVEYWERLNKIAARKNLDYAKIINLKEQIDIPKEILREAEIEEYLVKNLHLLNKFGYTLTLYRDVRTGRDGKQFVCMENRSRIDLLCVNKSRNSYVVIELKSVKATENTFGQISRYMGWVKERLARGKLVEGLVISQGADANFVMAKKTNSLIKQLNIKELGIK